MAKQRAGASFKEKLAGFIRRRWPMLIIIAAGLSLYAHGLHGGFVDDDVSQVQYNPHLNQYSYDINPAAGTNYYRPLMFGLFTTIDKLFGKNPFWYHLPQLALFLATGCLVFLLFKKFLGEKLALVLSLIFVIHPLNVDAVTYISHVQDVMFVFFGLLGWLLIERWNKPPGRKLMLAVGGLVLLSALGKETGLLFAPLLALYAYLYKPRLFKPVVKGTGAAVILYLIGWHFAPAGPAIPPVLGPFNGMSLMHRFISLPLIIWFYLGTFLWPAHLSVAYGWTVGHFTARQFWAPLIAEILVLAAAVYGFIKLRPRAQTAKAITFFSVWLGLALLPSLQLIPLDVTVAERWFYLPMIGLLGLVGVTASRLNWARINVVYRSLVLALAFFIAIGLFARSYARIDNFSDDPTLLKHDAASNSNYRLYNELGFYLTGRTHEYDQAGTYFLKSLAIQKYNNEAWLGLGLLATNSEDATLAENYFSGAVHYNQNSSLGYINLTTLYIIENKPADAEKTAKAGLSKWPDDAELKARLAQAQQMLKPESSNNQKINSYFLSNPNY